MAKPMTAAQWRAQLKKFGQKYRELPTFRNPESGRSSETGKEFGPVYGGCIHHTAGPDDKPNNADDAADSRVVNQGRTGLPGPLAHAGATDDGVIELHTTDRANHAGDGDRDVYNAVVNESYGNYPPRPDRDSVDGNDCLYGLEMYYTGTKPPKAAQYRAAVNWAAAFCDFHGWSAKSAIGHKEWTKRKIDPYGVDMAKFRRDVDARIKAVNTPAPPPAAPAVEPTLKVMTWNVKVNRSWTGAILPTLNGTSTTKGILETHKPDVVCLQECYDAPDLVGKVPGYTFRYQGYGYPPKTPGYIEERSNQVILVRDGVEVAVSAALEMLENWKGPVAGAWHDPRVHRRVTVRKDGMVWRVIDFHGPFGDAAIAESNAAMVECLNTFPQDEPIIIAGDFNQNNSTVVTRIGSKGNAVVDGGGIDLAVYKNCRKVLGQNLGNFGSDHPVKIWTFEA